MKADDNSACFYSAFIVPRFAVRFRQPSFFILLNLGLVEGHTIFIVIK
jgi:hypothetical protein